MCNLAKDNFYNHGLSLTPDAVVEEFVPLVAATLTHGPTDELGSLDSLVAMTVYHRQVLFEHKPFYELLEGQAMFSAAVSVAMHKELGSPRCVDCEAELEE